MVKSWILGTRSWRRFMIAATPRRNALSPSTSKLPMKARPTDRHFTNAEHSKTGATSARSPFRRQRLHTTVILLFISIILPGGKIKTTPPRPRESRDERSADSEALVRFQGVEFGLC